MIDKGLFSNPHATIFVSYSGGMDSHVLLHALSQAQLPNPLVAIHVHHGLSLNADQWLAHCHKVCVSLKVPLHEYRVNAMAPKGESREAYARKLRYHVLQSQLKAGDYLVMAHHQDDQAETLLLQLFRGAGIEGLASMGEQKPFGLGHLIRPFLNYTREDLYAYAHQYQLSWVNDESNQDAAFNRNFLRHDIIPHLKRKWPGLIQSLARSARHCATAHRLIQEFMGETRPTETLCISNLKNMSVDKQILYVRRWLKSLTVSLPHEKHMYEILKLINARCDANPSVCYGNIEIRRFKGNLYVISGANEPLASCYEVRLDSPQWLPGVGSVIVSTQPLIDGQVLWIPLNACLEIRFRTFGESFHPADRVHRQTLKKLFQSWEIPPWRRQKIPLLYANQTLACVVSYGIARGFSEESICRPLKISVQVK